MLLRPNLDDMKLWKSTTVKKWHSYVCLPPMGTPWNYVWMGTSGVTDAKERFIILNPLGDKYAITAKELAKFYVFANGEAINTDTVVNRLESGLMDWEEIIARPGRPLWAYHLDPKKYGSAVVDVPIVTKSGVYVANRSEVKHTIGDFLVCDDLNGRPDMDTLTLIPDRLFIVTHDMRSFPGLVDSGETISNVQKPKSIFTEKKLRQISARREQEEKEALEEQLDLCKDSLWKCSELLLDFHFATYLRALDKNMYFELLRNCSIETSTVNTNTSDSKTLTIATSVLKFKTGSKLYSRFAISDKYKVAATLQYVGSNNQVLNYSISKDTSLCQSFVLKVCNCPEIDNILSTINNTLEHNGDFLSCCESVYPYFKEFIEKLVNKEDITSCMEKVIAEFMNKK